MKYPNNKKAIRLREAAAKWVNHDPYSVENIEDFHDRKGQRLNRALLKAAIEYAESLKEKK